MEREKFPKVQSKKTQSRGHGGFFPFLPTYLSGKLSKHSRVSLQSPVCKILPNFPSNKNITAPEQRRFMNSGFSLYAWKMYKVFTPQVNHNRSIFKKVRLSYFLLFNLKFLQPP
jgi:hypothetical protein